MHDNLLTIPQCLALPETKALERQPQHQTLITAIRWEKLPAIKPGRDWLIKKTDYHAWLQGFPYQAGRKPTTE